MTASTAKVDCDSVLHMANVTLTVPDHVLRRARVHAAEQGTSVSGLVRDFLTSLVGTDEEFRRLERLQQQVLDEVATFSAAERISRDDAHDRALR